MFENFVFGVDFYFNWECISFFCGKFLLVDCGVSFVDCDFVVNFV